MTAAHTARAPVEGPLIRLWYFIPALLILIGFATLGGIAAAPTVPQGARIAAAVIVWAGPLLALVGLMPWIRRLDEFQTMLFLQAIAMAGVATLSIVVAMSFYWMLSGQAHGAAIYILIAEAPAVFLLTATLQIAGAERMAMRKARRAERAAGE